MPVAGSQSIESRAQPNKRIVIMDGSRLIDPSPSFRSPNFVTQNNVVEGVRSENQGVVTRFTYTVPTGKRARILSLYCAIIAQIAATSGTTTDRLFAEVGLIPSGGSIVPMVRREMNSNGYVVNDRDESSISSHYINAADAIVARDFFEGDAAGAGRIQSIVSSCVEEFDV